MKEYKKTRYYTMLGKRFHFRYAGWNRCINVIPYFVLRANPMLDNWSDFSIEFGIFIWSFGVRVEPIYC